MLLDRAAPILSKTKVISPQVFGHHTVLSFESLDWLFHPAFQSHRKCRSLNLAISVALCTQSLVTLKIKFAFMRPSDACPLSPSHLRVCCFCFYFVLFQEHLLLDFILWNFHSSEMIACWGRKDCKIYSLKSGCWCTFSSPSVYFLRVDRLLKRPRYHLTEKDWKLWKDYTLLGPLEKLTYVKGIRDDGWKKNNVLLSVFWIFKW